MPAQRRACCAGRTTPLMCRITTAEALSSFGFQYLSQTYLPLKLQEVRRGT